MNYRFDLIVQTAGEWAERPDLPAAHRSTAKTLHLLARHFGDNATPNLVVNKSLKVLGCHLCRMTDNATCTSLEPARKDCPLGFVPIGESSAISA